MYYCHLKRDVCRAKDLEGISIFVIYLCILPEVDIENIFLNSQDVSESSLPVSL